MVPVPQGDKKIAASVRISSGNLAGSPVARCQVRESLPRSVRPEQGAGRKLCKIGFPHPKALNPPDSNNLISRLACERGILYR